jgi:hypothetical protein
MTTDIFKINYFSRLSKFITKNTDVKTMQDRVDKCWTKTLIWKHDKNMIQRKFARKYLTKSVRILLTNDDQAWANEFRYA